MNGGQKFYYYHYIEHVFFLLCTLFSDISNATVSDYCFLIGFIVFCLRNWACFKMLNKTYITFIFL
ncbi:hypothetical protein J3Q64DRAFT_1771561, partial [Phycomyces blakesleeanus]